MATDVSLGAQDFLNQQVVQLPDKGKIILGGFDRA
jgi:hypothetical protein